MAPLIEDGTPNLSGVRQAVNDLEAAADAARLVRGVPRSAVLWESAEIPIAQAPGTVMLDTIIDLSRFALTLAQDIAQTMYVITKSGPDGTRVTTSSGALTGPDDPPADPTLSNLVYGFCFPAGQGDPDPDWDTYTPGPPQDFPTNEGANVGAVNTEVGDLFWGNRSRYLRAYIARNAIEYTPEEWTQIQADGYRVKLQILGPVQQVAEWTFPIPAAPGALVCNQIIDLSDAYGMTLGYDDCKFVATFERDGQTIRDYPGAVGARPWPTYTGEAFDPPTYPIEMDLHAFYPGYEHEIANSARAEWFQYGAPATAGNGFVLPGAGAHASVSFGACTRDVHSTLIMRAWRTADDGAADYVPAEGEAAIPVPAGAKDRCTLRIRLFRPHRLRQGFYPWFSNSELGDAGNVFIIKRRNAILSARVDAIEGWFADLPVHADNAAALLAGLLAGAFYRTAAGALMVVFNP